MNADKSCETKEGALSKCLEIAIDNRKLEIELFWKRTTIFWGFSAALFIGIAVIHDKVDSQLTFVFSILGAVFSLIWTLANRGSKSWQESWEIKADNYFDLLHKKSEIKKVYSKVYSNSHHNNISRWLRARDFSLSRLQIALSDFCLLFWIGMIVYLFPKVPAGFLANFKHIKQYSGFIFFIVGFIFSILIIFYCRSTQEGKEEKVVFKDNFKKN